MHILHMREAVGGRNDTGGSMLASHLTRRIESKVTLDRRNSALVGDVADVGWLDPEHTLAAILEIRQERAVIRSDVYDQVLAGEAEHGRALALQVGEVVA